MPEPTPLEINAESILDTIREPALVLNEWFHVLRANRSFYRTFETSESETIGLVLYELGNGQWDIPALRTLLNELLPRQSSFDDYEVTHQFEKIGRRVMLLNARRVEQDGRRPGLILLAIEDITERRQLRDERREIESRFTSLVRNIRDHSIFTLDLEGHVTSWNREAERILGFGENEAIGQHFSIIFTPEDVQAGVPAQELSTAQSMGRAVDERWHMRKGGERFWALGIVTPTQDASGAHTGYSKILRDMTERKRTEIALAAAAQRDEFLVRLGDMLRPLVDAAEIQATATRLLGQHLGASRAHYANLTEDGAYAIVPADYHDDVSSVVGRHHLDDYGPTIINEVRAGRTLAVNDVRNDSRLTDVERRNFLNLTGVEAAARAAAQSGTHARTARRASSEAKPVGTGRNCPRRGHCRADLGCDGALARSGGPATERGPTACRAGSCAHGNLDA